MQRDRRSLARLLRRQLLRALLEHAICQEEDAKEYEGPAGCRHGFSTGPARRIPSFLGGFSLVFKLKLSTIHDLWGLIKVQNVCYASTVIPF